MDISIGAFFVYVASFIALNSMDTLVNLPTDLETLFLMRKHHSVVLIGMVCLKERLGRNKPSPLL